MSRNRRAAAHATARPAESGTPGQLHAEAMLDELRAERERRASLEQRGLAVLSASGVLIALLLNGAKGAAESGWAAGLLISALVSITAAGMAGLLAAVPLSYGGLADDDLEENLIEHWDEDDYFASRRIGGHRLGAILISRKRNRFKAYLLRTAVLAAAVGVALTSSSVAMIILGAVTRR